MSRWRTKVARIALWSLLCVLVAGSVVRVVSGGRGRVVVQKAQGSVFETKAAYSWSEAFARDYLSWNADEATGHSDRLGRYTDRADPVVPADRRRCAQAFAEGVRAVDKGHAYVVVSCAMEKRGRPSGVARIAVPVASVGHAFTLFGDPVFLPATSARRSVNYELSEDADPAAQESAEAWLTSFFGAYARARTTTDLSGFVCAPGELTGLSGTFVFVDLADVKVYAEGSAVVAVAEVELRERRSGTTVQSTYVARLLQQQGRWCVRRLLP